ncbi:MAG: ATP-binding protein, partial [Clostridiales Family XIII bacterium]|nr:ATP-binding protein [Clostridiales Family XIII bacterium]
MLKLFEVTGFKNFESTIRLDFSEVRDYKFNNHCIAGGLLGKIIVYGKNSVGKSNLGLALFDIVSHMTTNNVTPGLYDHHYLNVNNEAGYAEFHYVFTFGSGEVDYRYRKNEKQTLVSEAVYIDGKLLFRYGYEDGSGDLSGLEALTATLNLSFRGSDSILKYAIANTALPDDHPLYQMQRFVSRMLWFRSLDENRYIGYRADTKDYFDFIFEAGTLEELEGFLHKAGIKENLVVKTGTDGAKHLYFDARTPLPFFRAASSGTKALYTFFYWYKTAIDVSLMFIDEFDAFYHFEMAEELVGILERMPGFQAILTS